jgi:MoxR-like ATPase
MATPVPAAPNTSAADASAHALTARTPTACVPPREARGHGLLRQLGIVGFDRVEPVVIAALALETPLLLIGPHGTAKSMLLSRLAQALGLAWRHYNASLVNYDDLIGYPLPGDDGALRFVQTPASVWDAEAVFVDELSRARPDMLNRLFPIIHERVVQGMPLPKLRYRWAAMNPPAKDEATHGESSYLGSEPLDPALADRFGFVLEVPSWASMSERDQQAIITSEAAEPSDTACRAVSDAIAATRSEMEHVLEYAGTAIADAVREVVHHASALGVALSGRRAAMLYRNIAAVHAASVVRAPGTDIVDSSWLAVASSVPQRAEGIAFDATRLMMAHTTAWKTARLEAGDPRRALACERDPVRRALRAGHMPQLATHERSAYVADAIAHLPPGGRQALGHWIVEHGHAASLIAPVAEQCAALYAHVAAGHEINQSIAATGPAHDAWREVTAALAQLGSDPDLALLANVLPSLFTAHDIAQAGDTARVIESWRSVRALLSSSYLADAAAADRRPRRTRRARVKP